MSSSQSKTTKHAKKKESMAHMQEKVFEKVQTQKLPVKVVKFRVLYMLIEFKETLYKELKEFRKKV